MQTNIALTDGEGIQHGTGLTTNVRREVTPARSNDPEFVSPATISLQTETSGAKSLVEALCASQLYQDYQKAFTEATGLPVALRPVESWQLPLHGVRNENPFCQLMAQKSRACAACLQVQQQLAATCTTEPRTVTCAVGLCDTSVPVRLGNQLVGYLQTGQVFRKAPTNAQFTRAAKLVREWGIQTDVDVLQQAYFAGKVLSARQHESVIRLLSIFAQHLSMVSNQIAMRKENAEPPVISRAKAFINEHYIEDISLGQVAKSVNTSTFYFCKIFRKATGLHFTDYVARVRIEKARSLLLNPNLRVSEIAYEVGFQSLTHFNRVFKKIMGESPTAYRTRLSVI